MADDQDTVHSYTVIVKAMTSKEESVMHAMSILLATDGSREALSAAEWVDRWADPRMVEITVAIVVTPPSLSWTLGAGGYILDADIYQKTYREIIEDAQTAARKALKETRAHMSHGAVIKEEILVGYPAKALVEYAKAHHVDLVVMGRRGHSALSNLVGSVSFGVLQRSPIPVTIVS